MHKLSSQIAIAVVAAILGVLVVIQLRSQAGPTGLAQLSSQDLTVLVANLNARNDQLRRETSLLENELETLQVNRSRGDVSIDEITADLRRVRAYAGLDPVGGPGVTITIRGRIDGRGVEELINELRNAGAEAIAAGTVRVVTGVVVIGAPGEARVDGRGTRGRIRTRRDRGAGQADRVADPIGRRHRPAGGHAARRGGHGHPGRATRTAGHDPLARSGSRAAAALIG